MDIQGYPPLGKNAFEARANVSDRTLQHELEAMEIKAAFHTVFRKSVKHSIFRFHTWPRLYEFTVFRDAFGREVPVKPDGFITIHEKEEGTQGYTHDFFLEVDRSYESLDLLVEKSLNYLEFYKSGGFAARNGGTREQFKDFPFRVLMVFMSAERRNNVAERLLQSNPPILTHTWLTTLAEAKTGLRDAIWLQPKDYRDVTRGTEFDTEKPSRSFAYRRQTERDLFIEHNVKKMRLLED